MNGIQLTSVSREDTARVKSWLDDKEVVESWYGRSQKGEALHIGYSPHLIAVANDAEWESTFNQEERKIFSVYHHVEGHIGEAQLAIEAALQEAQAFLLIGRKDLWYRGFGTAAMLMLLDIAFYTYALHRTWVDIPDYNIPALHVAKRVGFVLEGHLRSTHPKDNIWHDSQIMGLLADEYSRRRTDVLENVKSLLTSS